MVLANCRGRWHGKFLPAASKIAGCLPDTRYWLTMLLLSVACAAMAQQAAANFAVAAPVINMYAHPDSESEVVSQAIYGTTVPAIERRGSWLNIRTADGYTGWVAASGLRAVGGGSYAPEGRSVHVTALGANLYRDPDVTHRAPLLQLPWEARLELVSSHADDSARWLQVRLVDGETAWVQQGDVSAQFKPLTIPEMLKLARRFLGITYTWGGISSFGFDCSGFTQMLERQRGIVMPRDTDLQAAWSGAAPVGRKDLKPGDLLFFGSSSARITHTGMYLGDGEFIHDTTFGHPGVQISRLDDTPWTKLLVAARRIQ